MQIAVMGTRNYAVNHLILHMSSIKSSIHFKTWYEIATKMIWDDRFSSFWPIIFLFFSTAVCFLFVPILLCTLIIYPNASFNKITQAWHNISNEIVLFPKQNIFFSCNINKSDHNNFFQKGRKSHHVQRTTNLSEFFPWYIFHVISCHFGKSFFEKKKRVKSHRNYGKYLIGKS